MNRKAPIDGRVQGKVYFNFRSLGGTCPAQSVQNSISHKGLSKHIHQKGQESIHGNLG